MRRGVGAEQEEEEEATLVPPWLEPLLAANFFSPCAVHGDAARGECNMFCRDCPAAAGFCFYCRAARHADHRVIQIRRSSYHDVVRVSEVQRALDISGVQTYVINSARVVFLNERPQPRSGSSSSSAAAAAAVPSKSASHTCEICSRTLLDPFRFCSLGCKLRGIKRNGDACFVLDDEGAAAAASSLSAASEREGSRRPSERRRSAEGPAPERGGQTGGGASREGARHAMPAPTSPPHPSSSRRRKGTPHRSPLSS